MSYIYGRRRPRNTPIIKKINSKTEFGYGQRTTLISVCCTIFSIYKISLSCLSVHHQGIDGPGTRFIYGTRQYRSRDGIRSHKLDTTHIQILLFKINLSCIRVHN